MTQRYQVINNEITELNNKRLERNTKHENIFEFIQILQQKNILINEFDDELWNSAIEKVIVHSEHEITFVFKDGMELYWKI